MAWVLSAIVLLGIATFGLQAIAASSPTPAQAESTSAELEDEVEFDEEWEFEEVEEEDDEEFEPGGTAGPAALPPECVLSTASVDVIAVPDHGRVQLNLRYTAENPTGIGVEYWLKGSKGSLQLGSVKRKLGTQGVLHLSRHLDEREATKVRAARVIMVGLDVPAVDSYCKPFLVFRLDAKRQQAKRTAWSELQRR
jgi:hypothetical protein